MQTNAIRTLCILLIISSLFAFRSDSIVKSSDTGKKLSEKWIDTDADLLTEGVAVADISNDLLSNYDFSELIGRNLIDDSKKDFCPMLGALDTNYQKIQWHFDLIEKQPGTDPIYLFYGKTKLGDEIQELKGELTLTKVKRYFFAAEKFQDGDVGIVIGKYRMQESNGSQNTHVYKGTFKLTFEILVADDGTTQYSTEDQFHFGFVGQQKNYTTGASKQCLFGTPVWDYEYTDDFNNGSAEPMVRLKYIRNGWKHFSRRKWKQKLETTYDELIREGFFLSVEGINKNLEKADELMMDYLNNAPGTDFIDWDTCDDDWWR